MSSVTVRYMVDDVGAALESYTELLDLEEVMHPAPGFAAVQRRDTQ